MLPWLALALFAAPDVGPFDKTAPERAFPELKVYTDGSPLRRAKEDWDGAKKRVASDPQWAAWVRAQQQQVDEWIANRKDKVEWVAGWWHDFVSPKDGSFLTWTPDEPGPETLSSASDPKVQLTPKLHGGWVFGFRSRHTEKVLEAARLFRLTGDRKYAVWAASQLDFYADNYLKWPIQTAKTKARLMHQSLDDANVLVRLVSAARLLDVPSAKRQHWIDKLFRPEAELLDETFQSIHNIACWQRSAMAQAAIYAHDADLWKRAVDGPFGVRKQVEHGVTSEYLWFEQSFGYNTYVVSALQGLFTMASLVGRQNELRHEMLVIQNIMLSPIYMRFPNGQIPNPADATGGLPRVPNERFLASTYRVFPTSIGLAQASKLQTWDTLLDPPEAAPPVKLPEVKSTLFPTSQMAILRKGNWQVYFHYGQLHRSHAQAEALNYEAFFGSTDITHDPGTVGYGSPLHTGFYRTGAAHNVPMVDLQGQERWMPGELKSFAPDRVAASQPKYRQGVQTARDLRIDGDALIDVLTVEGRGRIGAVLHLQGKVSAPAGSESIDPVLPFWSNTRRISYKEPAVLHVQFADRSMKVTIDAGGPFTLTLGKSPDVPPAKRDSLYVETDGPRAVFTTRIEPTSPAVRSGSR